VIEYLEISKEKIKREKTKKRCPLFACKAYITLKINLYYPKYIAVETKREKGKEERGEGKKKTNARATVVRCSETCPGGFFVLTMETQEKGGEGKGQEAKQHGTSNP